MGQPMIEVTKGSIRWTKKQYRQDLKKKIELLGDFVRADSGSAMGGGNVLKAEGRIEITKLDARGEDCCFKNSVTGRR